MLLEWAAHMSTPCGPTHANRIDTALATQDKDRSRM